MKFCRELGLDELLKRMPVGLLQLVGETGRQLPHGERSRAREPDEYEIAHVEIVPRLLRQLQARFTELAPSQQYYPHCQAGVRSLKALNFLRQQGIKYIKRVKGGITARSEEIYSKVPRY